MTIMVAQRIDERNGRITQKQAPMRTPMNNTASVVRVRSNGVVRLIMIDAQSVQILCETLAETTLKENAPN